MSTKGVRQSPVVPAGLLEACPTHWPCGCRGRIAGLTELLPSATQDLINPITLNPKSLSLSLSLSLFWGAATFKAWRAAADLGGSHHLPDLQAGLGNGPLGAQDRQHGGGGGGWGGGLGGGGGGGVRGPSDDFFFFFFGGGGGSLFSDSAPPGVSEARRLRPLEGASRSLNTPQNLQTLKLPQNPVLYAYRLE